MVKLLDKDFGEGWLSRPARDLVKLVVWAGQDAQELVNHLIRVKSTGDVLNIRTVYKILHNLQQGDKS